MRLDAAVALVVDRSGSMQPITSDVVGSVKQFIGDQKKIGGSASMSVIQFDDKYDIIHDFTKIEDVDENKFASEYCPRGSTALLDAIGRTTIEMTRRLDSMPQEERPQRVVVAIITDGLENASKEYNIEQIKELIKKKEAEKWDFIFLGATLDAIDVAKGMGFSDTKAARYSTSNMEECMKLFSDQVTQARRNKEIAISEEERKKLMQKDPATTTQSTNPSYPSKKEGTNLLNQESVLSRAKRGFLSYFLQA